VSSDTPRATLRQFLGTAFDLSTRVWPDGCGPAGENFDGAWRRKIGTIRKKPPSLAVHFYGGGIIVIVRHGRAVQIRRMPGSSAAETAVETTVRTTADKFGSLKRTAQQLLGSLIDDD